MTPEESVPVSEKVGNWVMRQPLVPIALVVAAVASVASSVGEANWVDATPSYVNAIWLGLLCGAALAASRFRSPTAIAYSVCLSLLGSGEWVGSVLRPLWQGRPNVLWAMSVRLEALLLRIDGWGAALASRTTLHDAGLFIFLSTFILWNVGAWLVWNLVRRQRVWEGLLPAAALLAVNVYLSGQRPVWLGMFIGAACLLAAYASYALLQKDWDTRQVDYPTEVGVSWGISAILIVCVVMLAAQAALLFGTPTGWRTLGNLWHTVQRQTNELATRLFADVNPPRVATPIPPTVLAAPGGASTPLEVAAAVFPPDLQLIGDVPDQSAALVMWVRTSDPPPLPPDVTEHIRSAPPPQHYWRTSIFMTYTGRGWNPLVISAETQTSGPELYPAGRYRLIQDFDIPAAHGDNLFAANWPVTATAGVDVQYSPLGDSSTLHGTLSKYEVLSWVSNATSTELKGAGTNYPPQIEAAYLQLPPELPQRVITLADRITAGAVTPYDKALRIQEYLRANLVYTLKVPPPPAGHDAVDYFLFEAPGGFCSYYASAMAVMLRAEGVPARVVAGYAMGAYDFARGAYKVSGGSAHAWVEVFFPAYGWVEFEPTASRNTFNRPDAAAPVPTLPPEAAATESAELSIPWGLLGGGSGLLLLILLAVAVFRAYRDREPGWNTPRGRARTLYRQIRNALARAGIQAPGNLTPDEFIVTHEGLLASYPALTVALAEATRLYLRATFSPRPPASSETGRVRRLWFKAGGDWFRLWRRASRQTGPGKKPTGTARGRRQRLE